MVSESKHSMMTFSKPSVLELLLFFSLQTQVITRYKNINSSKNTRTISQNPSNFVYEIVYPHEEEFN